MNEIGAPTDCALCDRLCRSRKAVVNGSGPLPARVLVVAQNPGREEEIHGYPLYEKAFSGSRLRDSLMPLAGIDPALVRYENIVRCRPPRGRQGDLPPKSAEIANCRPFLLAAITACEPQLIITLGAPAFNWFFPRAKLDLTHGRMLHWGQTQLVPMYHPAAAHPRRNPRLADVMIDDWQRLGELQAGQAPGTLGRYIGGAPAGILPNCGELLAFDFETPPPGEPGNPQWRGTFQAVRGTPIGVSYAIEAGAATYIPTTNIEFMRGILENEAGLKVAHNAVFEYIIARKQGIQPRNLHCTKLMAYVLGRQSTHLKDLAWSELGIKQTRYEGVDWQDLSAVVQYGGADSDICLRLAQKFLPLLARDGLLPLYELERAALPALAEMTIHGVCLDEKPLIELEARLRERLGDVEGVIREYLVGGDASVNLNSDHQLRELLYGPLHPRLLPAEELKGRLRHDEGCGGCVEMACADGVRTGAQVRMRWVPPGLGWPVKARTDTGLPAVDMNTIRLYQGEPIVGELVLYKSIQQALEHDVTRLPKLVQEDGRIHPVFHQAGTWEEHGGGAGEAPITGRTSSSGPNLQNITHHGDAARPYVAEWAKDIRRAFIPSPGKVLFKADIGQEEPRIGAFLADDQALLHELDTGDVYCPVASLEYKRYITKADVEERQIGKRGWMAWLNGAGPAGVGESAFWLTQRERRAVVTFLQQRHPLIESYRAKLVTHLHEAGYTATHFGRRVYRPEVWSGPGPARAHAERSVMPDAIQGTAADVMKLWLPRITERLPSGGHLLLTVHDEVVGEVDPGQTELVAIALRTALTGILPIQLPCEIWFGPNWSDMVQAA